MNPELLYPELEGRTIDARLLADFVFRRHDHIDPEAYDVALPDDLFSMLQDEPGHNLSFVRSDELYRFIEDQTGVTLTDA